MVAFATQATAIGHSGVQAALLLAEQPLLQLDPVARARVLLALLALVILGIGLMLGAWLGARWARRTITRSDSMRRKHDVNELPSDWDRPSPASEDQEH